uniref:Uncharacterized protein n=1 Tax=Megaselia scalaris TaxID=36166 RepID=T1GXM3_MEGSC
ETWGVYTEYIVLSSEIQTVNEIWEVWIVELATSRVAHGETLLYNIGSSFSNIKKHRTTNFMP